MGHDLNMTQVSDVLGHKTAGFLQKKNKRGKVNSDTSISPGPEGRNREPTHLKQNRAKQTKTSNFALRDRTDRTK